MLGTGTRVHPALSNNTQLRGIHQAFVTFAQSNKKGGNDGYFPGLDGSGNVVPDGEATGFSGDGTQPAARMRMLLDGNFFTPDYMINFADARAVEYEFTKHLSADPKNPLTAEHFSYAVLEITGALTLGEESPKDWSQYGRAIEWKETLNTGAIVMGDRAIGTDRDDISSVWTETGSGDWRGGVVRNDNSTSFETTAEFEQTKYGNQDANELDHLFEDAPDVTDAFLVHEDAVMAYSAE
ncbi:MAG: hypothetical protein AAF086_05690 [Planctomycetota bacterium]